MYMKSFSHLFRRKIEILFCILITQFPTIQSFSQNSNLKFNHLTFNNGLPNNSITSIIEDGYGFMWFGSENGVFKYDGYEFKAYLNNKQDKNTIGNNFCYCIYMDRNKDIWTGDRSGLNLYNKELDIFTRFKSIRNKKAIQKNTLFMISLKTQKRTYGYAHLTDFSYLIGIQNHSSLT